MSPTRCLALLAILFVGCSHPDVDRSLAPGTPLPAEDDPAWSWHWVGPEEAWRVDGRAGRRCPVGPARVEPGGCLVVRTPSTARLRVEVLEGRPSDLTLFEVDPSGRVLAAVDGSWSGGLATLERRPASAGLLAVEVAPEGRPVTLRTWALVRRPIAAFHEGLEVSASRALRDLPPGENPPTPDTPLGRRLAALGGRPEPLPGRLFHLLLEERHPDDPELVDDPGLRSEIVASAGAIDLEDGAYHRGPIEWRVEGPGLAVLGVRAIVGPGDEPRALARTIRVGRFEGDRLVPLREAELFTSLDPRLGPVAGIGPPGDRIDYRLAVPPGLHRLSIEADLVAPLLRFHRPHVQLPGLGPPAPGWWPPDDRPLLPGRSIDPRPWRRLVTDFRSAPAGDAPPLLAAAQAYLVGHPHDLDFSAQFERALALRGDWRRLRPSEGTIGSAWRAVGRLEDPAWSALWAAIDPTGETPLDRAFPLPTRLPIGVEVEVAVGRPTGGPPAARPVPTLHLRGPTARVRARLVRLDDGTTWTFEGPGLGRTFELPLPPGRHRLRLDADRDVEATVGGTAVAFLEGEQGEPRVIGVLSGTWDRVVAGGTRRFERRPTRRPTRLRVRFLGPALDVVIGDRIHRLRAAGGLLEAIDPTLDRGGWSSAVLPLPAGATDLEARAPAGEALLRLDERADPDPWTVAIAPEPTPLPTTESSTVHDDPLAALAGERDPIRASRLLRRLHRPHLALDRLLTARNEAAGPVALARAELELFDLWRTEGNLRSAHGVVTDLAAAGFDVRPLLVELARESGDRGDHVRALELLASTDDPGEEARAAQALGWPVTNRPAGIRDRLPAIDRWPVIERAAEPPPERWYEAVGSAAPDPIAAGRLERYAGRVDLVRVLTGRRLPYLTLHPGGAATIFRVEGPALLRLEIRRRLRRDRIPGPGRVSLALDGRALFDILLDDTTPSREIAALEADAAPSVAHFVTLPVGPGVHRLALEASSGRFYFRPSLRRPDRPGRNAIEDPNETWMADVLAGRLERGLGRLPRELAARSPADAILGALFASRFLKPFGRPEVVVEAVDAAIDRAGPDPLLVRVRALAAAEVAEASGRAAAIETADRALAAILRSDAEDRQVADARRRLAGWFRLERIPSVVTSAGVEDVEESIAPPVTLGSILSTAVGRPGSTVLAEGYGLALAIELTESIGLVLEVDGEDLLAGYDRRFFGDALETVRFGVRIDGVARDDLTIPAGGPRRIDLGRLGPGRHQIEVGLRRSPGTVVARARLLVDRPLSHTLPSDAAGLHPLPPRAVRRYFLATPAEPIRLVENGPATLRLEIRGRRAGAAGQIVVRHRPRGATSSWTEVVEAWPAGADDGRLTGDRGRPGGRRQIEIDLDGDGPQEVVLEPSASLLVRLHRRVAGSPPPPPEAGGRRLLRREPPSEPAPPPVVADFDPPDRWADRTGDETGTFSLSLGYRNILDDGPSTGDRFDQNVYQSGLAHRLRIPGIDRLWHRAEVTGLLLEGSEETVLRVSERLEFRPPDTGLTLTLSGRGYLQEVADEIEGSLHLDAGISRTFEPVDGLLVVGQLGTFYKVFSLDGFEGTDRENVYFPVFNRFERDHDRGLEGRLAIHLLPFEDLHLFAAAGSRTNRDYDPLDVDRVEVEAGLRGLFRNVYWKVAYEGTWRRADDDRPRSRYENSVDVRLESIHRLSDRLFLTLEADANHSFDDDRDSIFVGLALHWGAGRRLRDFAPGEIDAVRFRGLRELLVR